MTRVISTNDKLQIDGKDFFPIAIAEYSPQGEEERIDVADGDLKYKIRSGIRMIEEIEVTFNVHRTENEELELMDGFVDNKDVKDVSIICEDAAGNVIENYLLEDCEFVRSKKSAFDRKAKTENTRKYFLLPRDISVVT